MAVIFIVMHHMSSYITINSRKTLGIDRMRSFPPLIGKSNWETVPNLFVCLNMMSPLIVIIFFLFPPFLRGWGLGVLRLVCIPPLNLFIYRRVSSKLVFIYQRDSSSANNILWCKTCFVLDRYKAPNIAVFF